MDQLGGTRLGPYQVGARLGEGGMGVVWRATDTSLGRDVALKVLPDAFSRDAERLSRFEREAKLLAALNHPNIAQIYGFETIGQTRALVMELVEGPTLAERLAQGPLPVDEALTVGRQIAEALEDAHEKAIVHRDLKPQNIKLTPGGRVKV
ncbi:MAG TPA: serine/threonine-protein kinase, partial [Candidatus Polarisedimenticolia bacterium]|nr:serine/threonine-protein kinase [Candidatus Polarisedimenticolia bacterium]